MDSYCLSSLSAFMVMPLSQGTRYDRLAVRKQKQTVVQISEGSPVICQKAFANTTLANGATLQVDLRGFSTNLTFSIARRYDSTGSNTAPVTREQLQALIPEITAVLSQLGFTRHTPLDEAVVTRLDQCLDGCTHHAPQAITLALAALRARRPYGQTSEADERLPFDLRIFAHGAYTQRRLEVVAYAKEKGARVEARARGSREVRRHYRAAPILQGLLDSWDDLCNATPRRLKQWLESKFGFTPDRLAAWRAASCKAPATAAMVRGYLSREPTLRFIAALKATQRVPLPLRMAQAIESVGAWDAVHVILYAPWIREVLVKEEGYAKGTASKAMRTLMVMLADASRAIDETTVFDVAYDLYAYVLEALEALEAPPPPTADLSLQTPTKPSLLTSHPAYFCCAAGGTIPAQVAGGPFAELGDAEILPGLDDTGALLDPGVETFQSGYTCRTRAIGHESSTGEGSLHAAPPGSTQSAVWPLTAQRLVAFRPDDAADEPLETGRRLRVAVRCLLKPLRRAFDLARRVLSARLEPGLFRPETPAQIAGEDIVYQGMECVRAPAFHPALATTTRRGCRLRRSWISCWTERFSGCPVRRLRQRGRARHRPSGCAAGRR